MFGSFFLLVWNQYSNISPWALKRKTCRWTNMFEFGSLFNFFGVCLTTTEWHQTAINIFVLFSPYSFILFFILPFRGVCYIFGVMLFVYYDNNYTFLEWNNTRAHICSHMLIMKYEIENLFRFAQKVGIFFLTHKSEMWDALYTYYIASSNSNSLPHIYCCCCCWNSQFLKNHEKKICRADGLDSNTFVPLWFVEFGSSFMFWCNWNRFLNGSIKPNRFDSIVSGLESKMYSSANKIQLTQTNKSNKFCREVHFVSIRYDSSRFAVAPSTFVH